MSITLNDLRADFDRAKRAAFPSGVGMARSGKSISAFARYFALLDASIDDCAKGNSLQMHWLTEDMIRTAKLYCIARDKGLEAAMLWKLSQP